MITLVAATAAASPAPPGAAPFAGDPIGPAPTAAPEGEPAAPVAVTVTPTQPRALLGSDGEIDVTVDVAGEDAARYVPVRALATVGTLELPRATAVPGRFVAR